MKRSKIPEVRMTKTARMRLLKANPLIKYEVQKTNNVDLVKNLNLDTVARFNKAIVENTILEKEPGIVEDDKQKYKDVNKGAVKEPKVGRKNTDGKYTNFNKRKNVVDFRRSLSAPRMQLKTGTLLEIEKEPQDQLNISLSCENVSTTSRPSNILHTFKTPSDKRNSHFLQSSGRKSLIFATPSAAPQLKRTLAEWLAKRNRKTSSFKHLKCFGVDSIKVIREDDKENVNTSFIEEKGSYENLKIDDAENGNNFLEETSLVFAPSDLERIAKEALKDLRCLISEGYPVEQCEAWLKIIRNKCNKIVEDPEYWECRAAVEQLRGDIRSAVECYKTAVVQGAEVSSIEQSLDQLLHKFKLLDIDSSCPTPSQINTKNDRKKFVTDFKNVFTSMLIKFAIQEKNLKNKSKMEYSDDMEPSRSRLIVTPVRRSTRLNKSIYASTPGVQICSSLSEIDEQMKTRMIFQTNGALNP